MFEGWDAAGKGGIIQRLTAQLDPRYFEVWPIGAPSDEEKARHFLWRFWKRLPGNREISIFDRSRSEEHTSELQSLMRISYAVFCLKNKKTHTAKNNINNTN